VRAVCADVPVVAAAAAAAAAVGAAALGVVSAIAHSILQTAHTQHTVSVSSVDDTPVHIWIEASRTTRVLVWRLSLERATLVVQCNR
jgi:hypothetical protein